MKFKKETVTAIRQGSLSVSEAKDIYGMCSRYFRKIKKGTVRKETRKPIIRYMPPKIPSIIDSSKPIYPFGLYPKVKYEIYWDYHKPLYSFVTTIHTEEESIKVLETKIGYKKGIKMYKTIDGVKTELYGK